jgi:signal transduction histidine kinase
MGMYPPHPLSPATRRLCAGGVRGFLLGCFFPLGAVMFLAAAGEPLRDPAALHSRFPLLYVIDLAPIVLGAAGCWIGALLHRSRQAEEEQRKLATTLAQIWSEGAVAQDADIESLLRNGYRRTAAVSHELRTPLTAIVGFIDLIEEDVDREASPATTYLDEIRSSCSFMIGLINEHLEMERSVAGVFTVETKPVHLEQAIESVVRLLTPVAQQRCLDLRFEARSEHRVMADPRRLQQVLTNLIANALNYTSHGGVTLSTSDRPGEVLVEIADTASE